MTSPGGRNPSRRNRNIGTSASGHGSNNKLVVPTRQDGPIWYWRDIGKYRALHRVVQSRDVTFVVEATNRRCVHACTVDDIAHLLNHVPRDDWEGLALFVLRQPKRKEALLEGVWGRLAYGGDIGRPQEGMFSGPAIFLEATEQDFKFTLPTSLRPDGQAEFERLVGDGHRVTRQGSRYLVQCTLETVRNTQLYRTVLHELGHWVDWLQKVKRPPAPRGWNEAEWRRELGDAYDRRPQQERESFAHHYAERLMSDLRDRGVIPFPRRMEFADLDEADFLPGLR